MPTFAVGLTPEEKKLYSQLFKALDPEGTGTVTGEKARATFEKSGLPPNILGEIWQLSDKNNLGYLSQFGFCHAMRLIGYTQAGSYPTATLADTPGPLPHFSDLPALVSAQPTAALLLQSQPSLLPSPLLPQDPVAPVSDADYHRFALMYIKTTGSASAPLEGNAARDIFLKAKLPTDTLGRIWALVDVANRGSLDLAGFVMAMHLIHGVLSGTLKLLPPFLPDHVWLLVRKADPSSGARATSYSSVLSQQTVRHAPENSRVALVAEQIPQLPPPADEWVVLQTQLLQMDSIFDSLDRDHTGHLSADQVASFLMTLRLDQADLAAIWDLADIQNTGVFGRLEFGLALFLVNRRRAGHALPNVVPDSLVDSIKNRAGAAPAQPLQLSQPHPPAPVQPPQPAPAASPLSSKPSALDELADIFGTPEPPKITATTTSSDLSYTSDLPKVRKQLTSSFKPTSSFGQTLLSHTDSPSLIGDDVGHSPTKPTQPSPALSPAPDTKARAVDYEALRSVPPPPPKSRDTSAVNSTVSAPVSAPVLSSSVVNPAVSSPSASRQLSDFTPASANNDLLADADVSGQLSEATSDIANISNQVKSLTGQTSNLHEKKIRAEQELARILAIKQEIEAKLKQLRTSYANEVAQVEQVEANLASAKEESEALRSEASITEAKLNLISTELNEKQMAVEELQKTNSSLKEKLGNMNAEIADLQKEAEAKTAARVQWTNDHNVKKSQLQVVLVKVDDYKRNIAELEAANLKLQQDIAQAHQDQAAAENQTRELQAQLERLLAEQKELHAQKQAAEEQKRVAEEQKRAAEEQKRAAEEQKKTAEEEKKLAEAELEQRGAENKTIAGLSVADLVTHASSAIGEAASVLAGAAAGGVAALAGSQLLSGHEEQKEASPSESVSKEIEPLTETVADVEKHIPEKLESLSLDELPEASVDATAVADIQVDQFVEEPSADLTGLGEEKTDEGPEATEFDPESIDGLKSRFPEVDYDQTEQTVSSSGAADSYRHVEGETPITSPETSEYRYLAGTAGVVGSLVGMPGVLVGVQRTDSLTSSVQNNAALSVRDDNVDTVSDRETLGEEVPSREPDEGKAYGQNDDFSEGEGEHHSSGVGLFELVNAEEAKFSEPHLNVTRKEEDLETTEARPRAADEEFPPIKELDYDESSSSDEETPEKFDDAVDSLGAAVVSPPAAKLATDFDDEFDNLAPAEEEPQGAESKASHDDFFDDEFDELTSAQEDKEGYDIDTPEAAMDDVFTGDDFGASSSFPDFSAPSGTHAQDGNDEWEQLFAGFGTAGTAAETVPKEHAQDSSKDLAIEELTGMGFERDVVVAALEKEGWDIEAATNYLLDSA